MLQRLLVVIRLVSYHIFGCQDVSFFQYFLGCASIFNFVGQLNNVNNMEKIFVRWTGVNLDRF